MTQFIEILKLIISLLPIIIDAINIIEAAIPGSQNGQAKLEAVKGIVQTAYSSVSSVTVKFETLWPMLQSTITSIVTAFNATGIFKKN